MSATAVVVAFGVSELDTSYLRREDHLIVVHNDGLLSPERVAHERTLHLDPGGNVGYGAGVNCALPYIRTGRTVLLNPDIEIDAEAWEALATARPDEVASIRLTDADGTSTSVVCPYPTPWSLLLAGLRVGRLFPRRLRWLMPSLLLGNWASEQRNLAEARTVRKPLSSHWVSGATLSIDTALIRTVNGFDSQFFLYFEDVDLCDRLARTGAPLVATVLERTGQHAVGGSQSVAGSRPAELHRLDSAVTYSQRFGGPAGRICRAALRLRRRLL